MQLKDIPPGSAVAVFGAGKQGRALVRALRRFRPDARIPFFLDEFVCNEVEGIPVITPDQFRSRQNQIDVVVVPYSRHAAAMANSLKAMGFASILQLQPHIDLAHMFWPEEWEEAQGEINEVCSVFNKDDRGLYENLMESRKIADCRMPIAEWGGRQYLDFLEAERIRVGLEGGVATGESTLTFIRELPQLVHLHAFEPFYDLFAKSPHRAAIEQSGVCTVHPVGLWRAPGRLWLKQRHAWSAILEKPDESGTCRPMEVTSIDAFAESQGIQVDFIKLDVEGGEMDVLEGAKTVLLRDRPQLAVSIYHTKEDMIRIPLYLSGLLRDYVFRLGHYSPSFSETVLYGIPSAKAVHG